MLRRPHPAALVLLATTLPAQAPKGFEAKVRTYAVECRDEAARRIEALLKAGTLGPAQVFDTFYVPVAGTFPQKYHTQYDRAFDAAMQDLLDSFLGRDPRLVYVVLADVNGYVPTHNRRWSAPLTGNREYDARHNRAKLLLDDRAGLAASRSTAAFLLQECPHDPDQAPFDLSVPLFVRDRHWGCVRIGFRRD